MERVDDQGGDGDRHQGEGDAPEGDIAQGQQQHRQVGEQIGPGEAPAGGLGDHQGQGVVSRRSCRPGGPRSPPPRRRTGPPAGPPPGGGRSDPAAWAGSSPTAERRRTSPRWPRRTTAESSSPGTAGPGRSRPGPAAGCTGSWGCQPVLRQQQQSQYAPLGDAGAAVDVVDAEGGDGRPQEYEGRPSARGPHWICFHFCLISFTSSLPP